MLTDITCHLWLYPTDRSCDLFSYIKYIWSPFNMTSEKFKDIYHVPPKISLSQVNILISSNTSSAIMVYGAFSILLSLAYSPVYQGFPYNVS